MLRDAAILKAVSRIKDRSEREDLERLAQSYVECGVLTQIENENNQILFGRRGTGKTHVLRYFERRSRERGGVVSVYLDMRGLGSAGVYLDSDSDAPHAALSVYRDTLASVHELMREVAHSQTDVPSQQLLNALDEFADQITWRKTRPIESERAIRETGHSQSETGVSAESGSAGPLLKIAVAGSSGSSTEASTRERYREQESVDFNGVARSLTKIAREAGIHRIYLLLDEWTAMHPDVQLYVAEFLKRTFAHLSFVTMKIGALEYRANFGQRTTNGGVLGLELGADLPANVELDDYFVYDRETPQVEAFFCEVAYRHLITELPNNYLRDTYGADDAAGLRRLLFSGDDAFKNLVRAAEGVVRDFLHIFCHSAYDAYHRNRERIDVQAVVKSAQWWYESDKYRNLNEKQRMFLDFLIDDVIGKRLSRSFLLDRHFENHPMVRSLVDSRVLHIMKRGYSDKNQPGTRSNIYTLDYGTYVDLRTTQRTPQMELVFCAENEVDYGEVIVPFDDFRTLRRTVLDPRSLPDV
jgi:hypothetical protein